MRRRRFARDQALGHMLFLDLYMGALRIDDHSTRLIATTFLLLSCRLKMRKSELMHFHEGWLRREYGLIQLPEFEPCHCTYCWERAQKNHHDKEEDEKVYENPRERLTHERYRTKNRRNRFVGYSWSPRIISAIEAYVDQIGVYPNGSRQATRLLQEQILENTAVLEPDDVTWPGCRATGDTFWAFAGIGTKERAEIGGHRETELGTYSGTSPIEISNELRENFGKESLDFPVLDPVTTDPRPYYKEPFQDPRDVDPMANYNPAKTAPTFNPRSDVKPADVDVAREDFNSINAGREAPPAETLERIYDEWDAGLDGDPDEDVDPYKEKMDELREKDGAQGIGQTDISHFCGDS